MKICNRPLRKSGASIVILVIFCIFICCSFGLVAYNFADIARDEKKADTIISSYYNNIKKTGYLTVSDKAKLVYELKNLHFEKVEIVAPDKKTDDKVVSFTVTVGKMNLSGGIVEQKSYSRDVKLDDIKQ